MMTFEITVEVTVNERRYRGIIPERSITLSVWDISDDNAKWVGSAFYDAAQSAAGIAFKIAELVNKLERA